MGKRVSEIVEVHEVGIMLWREVSAECICTCFKRSCDFCDLHVPTSLVPELGAQAIFPGLPDIARRVGGMINLYTAKFADGGMVAERS